MGKKLIEVSLPLEAINKESAREKSIRHGHPSTLHLWWARRPLATARAVLFAQLVDDPSAHPEQFPTEEEQATERKRLHKIIEDMVPWEATRDERVMQAARDEIMRSTGGNPPPILDPFAGGGTIPLEAQRLGLEAHASDLNPVAVLINKALIEYPPMFRDWKPVGEGVADTQASWRGAEGLAADVRHYGEWMRDEAERRIGHLYPNATLPDGSKATVIAWIWARTVTCPNPACGIEMPLVRSWWLGKKKGKEAYVVPSVVDDPDAPSGKRVKFDIGHDPAGAPSKETDGTVGRKGAHCIACEAGIDLKYIRQQGQDHGLGSQLMAVVAEGSRRRTYLAPNETHTAAADVPRPHEVPSGVLPKNPRDFKTPNYGLETFDSLFTNRQLVALTTFSDLVGEARARVFEDALTAGHESGDRLDGSPSTIGAATYADAVAVYLGIVVSRLTDYQSSITTWASNPQMEILRNVFARQAIPMAWDFAEGNPFFDSSGSFARMTEAVSKAVEVLPAQVPASAEQRDAIDAIEPALISTDPPFPREVSCWALAC